MPGVRCGAGTVRAGPARALLLAQLPGAGVPAAQAPAGADARRRRGADGVRAGGAAADKRRRIVEAVWWIAAERGLHAASMREVAARAGVSVRAVQYHFADKHRLLVDALRLLHEENERIARTRIRFDPADPRGLLRSVLDEFLPLDAQRTAALRVFAAYYARSLTDPALAGCSCPGTIRWRSWSRGSSPRPGTPDAPRPGWTSAWRPTCWWRPRWGWAVTCCTAGGRWRRRGGRWSTAWARSSPTGPVGPTGRADARRRAHRDGGGAAARGDGPT
ncbi:TetR/AcrR family transcriptional regulator [Streptomyces albulus]|nr:TetR/AcrR family transcriptional regulator [Streptomyces noursei]